MAVYVCAVTVVRAASTSRSSTGTRLLPGRWSQMAPALPVLGEVVQGHLAGGTGTPVHGDPGADRRQTELGEPAVGVLNAFPLFRDVVSSRLLELLTERVPDRKSVV